MNSKTNLTSFACIIADIIREHFGDCELTEIDARSDSAEVDFKQDGHNYRFVLAHDKYKDDKEAKEKKEREERKENEDNG